MGDGSDGGGVRIVIMADTIVLAMAAQRNGTRECAKRTIENIFLPLKMKNVFYLLACFCIDHKRSFMLDFHFPWYQTSEKVFRSFK